MYIFSWVFFYHFCSPNEKQKICTFFEDVDLPESVKTVIGFAWPRLQKDCIFFSHEARDLEIVSIFYNNRWWKNRLNTPAPGLIGSGIGLPLSMKGSYLAYALKRII